MRGQCPDGTPAPCARPARATAPTPNSVAVLPFANVRRDTTDAYLADGLATAIATSLGQVQRLEVRSPGFVRRVARAGGDERALGRRLEVRYVVEGEFQRGGDRIRVAVRLVSLPNGTERWADAFTRPSADLLAVEEDIAREVATHIAGALLPMESRALAARPTRSAAAYDLLLRGNFYLAQRTVDAVRRAIGEYEAATRLDSGYADPLARVAYAYGLVVYYGWDLGPLTDTLLARGVAAADRALKLDSASSDAWMARGYLLTFLEPRTFAGVVPALQRAVRLDPRNAEAWHQLGTSLMFRGQLRAADTAFQRAVALEPDRLASLGNLATLAEYAHRPAEARRWNDSALAINPTWLFSLATRLRLALARGDTATILATGAAIDRVTDPAEVTIAMMAKAQVAMWRHDTAAGRADADSAADAFAAGPPVFWRGGPAAGALAVAGEADRALDVLERIQPRGAILSLWLTFSFFDALHGNPRFQALVAQTRPPEGGAQ